MSKSIQQSRKPDGALGDAPSRDDVFEVLSNQRRRYVFHHLRQRGGEAYLRDLSDRVAAWENEKDPREVTAQERKRVQTALHQFHLPRMEERGFLTYDPDRRVAELSEPAAGLQVYLDVVPGKDVPWAHLYVGLAVVGALATLAVGPAWAPLATVPDAAASVFLVVVLGVTATVHGYYTHSRLQLGSGETPPEVREG